MENNAEQPAYPCIETRVKEDTFRGSGLNFAIPIIESSGGLTKRELIAAMIAQGLCANPDFGRNMTNDDWDDFKKRLVTGSVEIANELLSQLQSKP